MARNKNRSELVEAMFQVWNTLDHGGDIRAAKAIWSDWYGRYSGGEAVNALPAGEACLLLDTGARIARREGEPERARALMEAYLRHPEAAVLEKFHSKADFAHAYHQIADSRLILGDGDGARDALNRIVGHADASVRRLGGYTVRDVVLRWCERTPSQTPFPPEWAELTEEAVHHLRRWRTRRRRLPNAPSFADVELLLEATFPRERARNGSADEPPRPDP